MRRRKGEKGAIAIEYVIGFTVLLLTLTVAGGLLAKAIKGHARQAGSVAIGGIGQKADGTSVDMQYQLAPCRPGGGGILSANDGECY